MCKLDLKDAYLTIPVHPTHQQFLRFQWQQKVYQYTALPFGLASAPRVFTKLMKPALACLRSRGVRLIAYLDDLLIIGKTSGECISGDQTTSGEFGICCKHGNIPTERCAEVGISGICHRLGFHDNGITVSGGVSISDNL